MRVLCIHNPTLRRFEMFVNAQAIGNISNFSQVEDVEVKPTTKVEPKGTTSSEKKNHTTVVVYNAADMMATLVAAIIKDKYPTAKVLEVSQNLPDGYDQYVWLGVEPHAKMFTSSSVWKRVHIVATDDHPIRQFIVKTGGPGYRTLGLNEGEVYHSNMAGRILTYLQIDFGRFGALIDLVGKFYTKELDLSLLAFVYDNCTAAKESLMSGKKLVIQGPSQEQVGRYLNAVKAAKLELTGNYAVKGVEIQKKKIEQVFVTCNIHDFWLVRRLAGFVYSKFANTRMMLRGPSVQANFNVEGFADFSNVTVMR